MTLSEAQLATGARAILPDSFPEHLRFSTDSRTLSGGQVFVALRGERFDGHAFIRDAVARGAAAVVVDDASTVPDGVPALVVADVKAAYLALAAAARRRMSGNVVAITGSTGKTTTKELLAQLLRSCGGGTVVATHANENNEIGVSKLLLTAPPSSAAVVVECGARHPGDIATLVEIARPDVAVLTNVGDAHLELMGSAQALADAKWSIFSGGARAVLCASDAVSRERAHGLRHAPSWFAAQPSKGALALSGAVVTIVRGRSELVVCGGGGVSVHRIRCTVAGEYNRTNVAAACAAALELGCDPRSVAATVETLELPEGRYERTRVGDLELIFDAYNASMAGTIATLEAFSLERAQRRIAVLSSMAELGEGAAAMHELVGAAAARADLSALLVGGENALDLERGARSAGIPAERLVRFASNAEAIEWLSQHARAGDLVLLKGSRRYRLEEVVEGLRGARRG